MKKNVSLYVRQSGTRKYIQTTPTGQYPMGTIFVLRYLRDGKRCWETLTGFQNYQTAAATAMRREDLRRIERGLKRGPQALGYESGLWTSARVAHLIEKECGVRYHAGHAWRILRQLGWSCQRPAGRALERDEEKIRRWKQKRWPELKKTRKTRAARSSSSTKAD